MADDSFRHRVQDAWGTACLICERSPSEWISSDSRRLVNSLHHINGDDTDDRVANVIPLCQRCHIHVHKTDAPPYRQWHRQLPIEHRHAWNAHHKAYYEGPRLNSVQAEWFFGDDEGTPESARSHDQQSAPPDGSNETAASESDATAGTTGDRDSKPIASAVDEEPDASTSDRVRRGVDPDLNPETVSIEYTPSSGDRRRIRFVDRDDGPGWWQLEEVWTGQRWRPVGREPIMEVDITTY